jgi:alpha-L-rhamnosidase
MCLTVLFVVGTGTPNWQTLAKPAAAQTPRQELVVDDLRCEHLINPIGIETQPVRLSWKMHAYEKLRGVRQSAFRILVASQPDLLIKDRGDLWDSGEVESPESVLVPYSGSMLMSNQQCHWKVKVRDAAGAWTAWSAPATWTMGLLQASDWKGKWIGPAQQHTVLHEPPRGEHYSADPWLRKTFQLDEKPLRAMLQIASVGYHELYVNGQRIGTSVLAPSVSDHSQRARYVTHDITDELSPGKNVIAVWLGTSWSIFPSYEVASRPRAPIVKAQATLTLANGKSQEIYTDATWKIQSSPNALLGSWWFRDFGGEFYDGQRELPAWASADLDDSQWSAATTYRPELKLSADIIEPNRRVKEIRPVEIKPVKDGVYRVDMGTHFTGFLEVTVRGKPGTTVMLNSSEHPDHEMTWGIRSAVRIGPTGETRFRNRFNYHSGRWVTLAGVGEAPQLEDICGYLVRNDYARTGHFESSHQMLNAIYDATAWTFENLSLGGYVVDCPHRERMGYGGDAHATTQTALNLFDLAAFYTKWAEDWRDVQGKTAIWGDMKKPAHTLGVEAGHIPYTAPTYWGGGGPAWSGIGITLPWFVYLHCGDVHILEENFPMMQHWLAFLEGKSQRNQLVRWGGDWDFLGDWVWPEARETNGGTRGTLFFNNCYWIYNLATAADVAEVLGKTEIAAKYRRRAAEIRTATHAEFFDAETGGYVDNLQAALAIALVVDLPPPSVRSRIEQRFQQEVTIHRNGHFWGGITGGFFIFQHMLQSQQNDLAFGMVTKDKYPGWSDMLNRGATTFWETWEGDLSRMHSSYLHVGAWFIEGLAGIVPDPKHPGYKHFYLKPGIIDSPDLTWVKASLESPYGLIRSHWQVDANKLRVDVSIPANSHATLILPTSDAAQVTEGAGKTSDSFGVTEVKVGKNSIEYVLESGDYTFQAPRLSPAAPQSEE